VDEDAVVTLRLKIRVVVVEVTSVRKESVVVQQRRVDASTWTAKSLDFQRMSETGYRRWSSTTKLQPTVVPLNDNEQGDGVAGPSGLGAP